MKYMEKIIVGDEKSTLSVCIRNKEIIRVIDGQHRFRAVDGGDLKWYE